MKGRARRSAVWLTAALIAVAAAGITYLRPTLAPAPALVQPARPVQEQVVNVVFADANHGQVVVTRRPQRLGTPEVLYRTSDGGRTWSRGDGNVYLDPPAVIQWGAAPRISTDGGRTWRPLALPEPLLDGAPTFLDSRHGWWLAGADGQQSAMMWRTDDGGGSWQRLAASGLPVAMLDDLSWLDPLRGVASMVTGGGPALFATGDGGQTWQQSFTAVSPLPGTSPLGLWLVRGRHHLVAWLVTLTQAEFNVWSSTAHRGLPPALDAYPYAVTSDDGGRTWGPAVAGPSIRASSIGPPILDGRGRLLLLDGRRLWVSEDDGATWTSRVTQAPSGRTPDALLTSAGDALFATAISDEEAATDVRYVDTLLRSTDGGVHWEQVRLP